MRKTRRGRLIAYFSMEIAVEPEMPTYSGGLGVLAGDLIRTAADLEVPMVGVTLLHRKGYFSQRIGPDGQQQEEPMSWEPERFLRQMPQRASVELADRSVYIRAWQYPVQGLTGFTVPVYFLDTDLAENAPEDRTLTHFLYGGDARYRLSQEAVFGIGGLRMLRVLGYEEVNRFHINEGHASLLTLALIEGEARRAGRTAFSAEDLDRVRDKCIFTTHTPIRAGHDRFPMSLAAELLGRPDLAQQIEQVFSHSQRASATDPADALLDMTGLALHLSGYVNGVSRKNRLVSQAMYPDFTVESVTNGVHAPTWTSEPFQQLYDRYLPEWRQDNFSLRKACAIPAEAIWQAHAEAKERLLAQVQRATGVTLPPEVLTIGFARRATAYKRADLILTDLTRLQAIASQAGPFQLIYAGKAHPHDQEGKEAIRKILEAGKALAPRVRLVFLENYDMTLGKLLTAGVDLWLNTPLPPLEASGTSGMKAALNGVPSLSILDGWWAEGHLEGVTGWAIGEEEKDSFEPNAGSAARDAGLLYDKLEKVIVPTFYHRRPEYLAVMRQAIAVNGAYFHSQRMLQQYLLGAYFG